MTHEEIVKEFKKAISYQTVGSHPLPPLQNSDVVVGALIVALTTYRAQVLEEAAELAKQSHAEVIKNCEKHPKGAQGCAFCYTSKLSRIALGGFLAKLKDHTN